ncbi:DUF4097 family beta strand repeat-containing protein [Aureibacillus halotolerans]|uniref:DUF4097 and DUF4098 domain-containing protein YvlB n=1 Tax=Aureibacillus halotolerans TaxID=1508390 RepID=A0A4R6TTG1_9BACI|nr:DUF4097 family beta strand repeat-containing protein [Aureibacillus halotolerans]TDQ36958.1 DUF4097 and DUF4098 domain-containing protein YvlB [Aureibacillus halotolerans]
MSEEQRKAILNKVKEGTLTIDEALVLLESEHRSEKQQQEPSFQEKPFDEPVKPKAADAPKEADSPKEEERFLSPHVHIVEDEDEPRSHHSSKKMRWSDYFGEAVGKIRNLDLDLNFGSYEEVHHTFLYHDTALHEFDVYLYNGDFEVVPTTSDEVRIECHARVYNVTYKEQAKQQFMKQTRVDFEDGRFTFRLEEKTIKADCKVYIPSHKLDRISIKLFNGALKGNNIASKTAYFKSTNGGISQTQMAFDNVEVETVNGHIHMEGQSDSIDLETVNGTILARGAFQRVVSSSFHGNISVALENEAEHLKINTTSGSIDIRLPEHVAVTGKLHSTFGDLNVNLPEVRVLEDVKEVVKKRLAFEKGNSPTPMLLVATARTGGVTVHTIDKERTV